MSMRRAAPGPQLSEGRIRVDAARAIKKLRDYQLTDRAAWVLEGIRAAVAAGATQITLDGDANDIWLGWHGPPWEPEVLPRLFDELVSPEVSDEKHAVRLLAAAVNSALGMNPAFVDVYAITARGTAQRARYTPEVLAEPENDLGEALLRHVAVEHHAPPCEIHQGMLVHLRRRASLSLLSYWIGEPPELPLARAACRDVAVPVVIDGEPALQRDGRRDLVRVPLEEGLDGFVAITHETIDPRACFEVAERGVVLARYDLEVLGYQAKVPVPIRIYVDAPRLPTNASRSQVRRDVHPIATAERRAKQLMATAIAKLAALVTDAPADIAQQARKAAFSLLASAVAGHPVGWTHIPSLLEPLGKLDLVRNAFGEPRPLTNSWSSFIYSEKRPLDADLAPWVHEALWAPPDDPVRILLAGFMIDVTAMRRHVRWARSQRRAHKRFLEHSRRELKVQTTVPPRVRVPVGVEVAHSCVPQNVFDQVTGEICLYADWRNAAVALCVDSREIERLQLTSTIGLDAVVDSPLLEPGERYRRVERDAGFSKVETAVRAAVVRAVEWLLLDGETTDADMPLVRSALVLAKELEYPPVGPLVKAGAWRRVEGGTASYAELREQKCIGVLGEGQQLVPPAGRVIVRANIDERGELRALFGTRVVSYAKAVEAKRADLRGIADAMPRVTNGACLLVRMGDMQGVITLAASKPTLHLHHCGVPLGERSHNWTLVRSSIALDSDALIPNEKWTGTLDVDDVAKRSFRDWELALVRALASVLLGDDVPALVAPAAVTIGDLNYSLLCDVLTSHDPLAVLGADLYDRLRAHPMFTRLGEVSPVSANELRDANPMCVYTVDSTNLAPVDDFAPVVCDTRTARLLAKLTGKPLEDGKPEIVRRRQQALRKTRIEQHLAQPHEPTQLASDLPTVTFRGKVVRGVLALTDHTPTVHVFVENRRFTTLQPSVGYPVSAAVDLALAQCNDDFDGIPNLTIEEITEDLRDAVPALLAEIAAAQPRLFGVPGPARRALWALLQAGTIKNHLRDTLRAMPAFETINGPHISVIDAEGKDGYLPVAAYADEWLPAEDGEPASPYDKPIVRVARPVDELQWVIGKLHMDGVTDVTQEVGRLQARRRMARGLLPMPKLPGLPNELKRPLKDFGALTKRLGHGEVGFAMTSVATLLIHEHGQLQRTVDIDVQPAILLAIEAPHEEYDHGQMLRLAQDIATELVRTALPTELPIPLRKNLARAVLTSRVPPAAIGSALLFQRTSGDWIDWRTFKAQLDRYDDVWALTSMEPREPLDPERIVIVLDASDIELAAKHGHKVINAKIELELDQTARQNMARGKARTLELPSREGVLAEVALDGNGRSAPRGNVAVLSPQMASRRAMYAHRGMHPFDKSPDVCRWPTIAMIDDVRIAPDRTWSRPKGDDTWAAISKEVRAASEQALAQIGEAPPQALAQIRITSHVCSDVRALREAPRTMIRGLLWLSSVPFARNTVSFRHAGGIGTFVPEHGIAVGGEVAIFTEDDLDIGAALEQLCGICHGKLTRMLLKDDDVDRDVALAHIAHALAIGSVKPTEVNGVEFACFAPEPLEPRQLASLFRRKDPVPRARRGMTDLAETAFVDDHGEVAKVVARHLGERLTDDAPLRKAPPPPKPPKLPPPVSVERSPLPMAPPPPPPPRPPEKPHVLQPLVDAVAARIGRLGISAVSWGIDPDVTKPVVIHDNHKVVFAGANQRLRAVAAELAADSIRADAAIDALAAHIVTLLNIVRTDITDASEMHALGVLLTNPPSADPPRSRRSS